MPSSSVQESVQNQLMKWGFDAVITLIGAGLLSLANRNVYSKEEVDTKFHHVQEVQELQNEHMNKQLIDLKSDTKEIKELIKENHPR